MGNNKTETFKWFQQVAPHERIEYVCNILHLCLPTELRYFGSYLENLASKDFSSFKDNETLANNSIELEKVMSTKGSLANASLFLSLLNSKNTLCANILFEFLMNNGLLWSDIEPNDKVLLTYTLAVYHPAFTFHQHQVLSEILNHFKCRSKTKNCQSNEIFESNKPQNAQSTECIQDISVESLTDCSETSDKPPIYEVKVTKTLKTVSTVQRCRKDFEKFHQKITQQFSNDLENGMAPKVNFDCNYDEMSNVFTKYLRHFLKLPPSILYSSTMKEFLYSDSKHTMNHISASDWDKIGEHGVHPAPAQPVQFDIDKEYYSPHPMYFPHYAYYPDNPFWSWTQPKVSMKGHYLPGQLKMHTMSSPSFVPPTFSVAAEHPDLLTTSLPTSFSTPQLKEMMTDSLNLPPVVLNPTTSPSLTNQMSDLSTEAHNSDSMQQCPVPTSMIAPAALPVCPPSENSFPASPPDRHSQMKYSLPSPAVSTVSEEPSAELAQSFTENGPISTLSPECIEPNSMSKRAVVHVPQNKGLQDVLTVRSSSSSHLATISVNSDASIPTADPPQGHSQMNRVRNQVTVNVGNPVSSASVELATNPPVNSLYSPEAIVSEHQQPMPLPNAGNMPLMKNPNFRPAPCQCQYCMSGQYSFPSPLIATTMHQSVLAPSFTNFQSLPFFPYNPYNPFRPPPVIPAGNSSGMMPPLHPSIQPIRHATCYNCGQMGHNGARCKAKSIESRFGGEGSFHLNYAPSVAPSNTLSSD